MNLRNIENLISEDHVLMLKWNIRVHKYFSPWSSPCSTLKLKFIDSFFDMRMRSILIKYCTSTFHFIENAIPHIYIQKMVLKIRSSSDGKYFGLEISRIYKVGSTSSKKIQIVLCLILIQLSLLTHKMYTKWNNE